MICCDMMDIPSSSLVNGDDGGGIVTMAMVYDQRCSRSKAQGRAQGRGAPDMQLIRINQQRSPPASPSS